MDYSQASLGRAIRYMRESHQPKMTQEELGTRAGYGAGAGVSVSRIESGATSPGQDRLARIARALGTTPGALASAAAQLAQERDESVEKSQVGGPNRSRPDAGSAELSVKERVSSLQHAVDNRTRKVRELGESFNCAHDAARDEFFLPFVSIASRVARAPKPPVPESLGEDSVNAEAEAEYRLMFASNGIAKALLGGAGGAAAGALAGGAAAYASFTGAAMLGTASTGAAIAGLSGAAATNATLALLGGGSLAAGGAGVAGGTALLTGIIAAPVGILALGGLIWVTRRNRRQDVELRQQLDQAETELAETQRGFEALADALVRGASALEYIRIHASHALARWDKSLPASSTDWSALTAIQQQRYRDFIEVAACQVSVATLNLEELVAFRGQQLDHAVDVAGEVLTQAQASLEALV